MLLAWAHGAWSAGEAAVVISISGTVSAQQPDGKVRILAKDSPLTAGEIVLTQKDSSVQMRFRDHSQVTLRPNTQLVIENFSFDEAKAQDDKLSLYLIKGVMRALSGLVGKRSMPEAYRAGTLAGTIGIRGTDYALMLCGVKDENCLGMRVPNEIKMSDGTVPAGLYLNVFDGLINFTNRVATINISEGQAAYVQDQDSVPVLLSADPGPILEIPNSLGPPGLGMVNDAGNPATACVLR